MTVHALSRVPKAAAAPRGPTSGAAPVIITRANGGEALEEACDRRSRARRSLPGRRPDRSVPVVDDSAMGTAASAVNLKSVHETHRARPAPPTDRHPRTAEPKPIRTNMTVTRRLARRAAGSITAAAVAAAASPRRRHQRHAQTNESVAEQRHAIRADSPITVCRRRVSRRRRLSSVHAVMIVAIGNEGRARDRVCRSAGLRYGGQPSSCPETEPSSSRYLLQRRDCHHSRRGSSVVHAPSTKSGQPPVCACLAMTVDRL